MKYLAVLPFAFRPYLDDCVGTMHPDFKENVLFIDDTNPATRIGIMKAHNKGGERMRELDADWLIIISAAIRFGKAGGLDFVNVLNEHLDHYVIHAASSNVKGGLQHKPEGKDEVNEVKGWHLTAFRNEVFDNIGFWDENFSPYGLDDIDLSLRLQKFYKGKEGWNTYPIDVHDVGMSHSINLSGVFAPYEPRNEYFKRKWGRDGGDWESLGFERPFNNQNNPLSYWPKPNDPLSIQNNEYKL